MSHANNNQLAPGAIEHIDLNRGNLWHIALADPRQTMNTLLQLISQLDTARIYVEKHPGEQDFVNCTAFLDKEAHFHTGMANLVLRLAEHLGQTGTNPADQQPTHSHWDLFETLIFNKAGRSSFTHLLPSQGADAGSRIGPDAPRNAISLAGLRWFEHQAAYEIPRFAAGQGIHWCIGRVNTVVRLLCRFVVYR